MNKKVENIEACCPVCGSIAQQEIKPYKNTTPSKAYSQKSFVSCGVCGVCYMYPMPSDAEIIEYNNLYWDSRSTENCELVNTTQALSQINFFSELMDTSRPEIKVLDIGSGFGFFLKAMKEKFSNKKIKYQAVELDEKAVQYLLDEMKANAVCPSYKDSSDIYDIIAMSHILEHFPEPKKNLEEISKLMDENSLLFIEVPNQDYKFKSNHEPHLVFYNPNSIRVLLERAGYSVLRIRTCGDTINEINERKKQKASVYQQVLSDLANFFISFFKSNKDKTKHYKTTERYLKAFDKYSEDGRWIRVVANIRKNA